MRFKNSINTFRAIIIIAVIGLSTLAIIACGNSITATSNKNEAATQTDTNAAKSNDLKLIADLDVSIKETSGLSIWNGFLITHNDRGRANQLMLLNPENGNIEQALTTVNFQNNDWEDLAKNDDYLFVGDIGNNEGERKNLAIYLIPLKEIKKSSFEVKSNGTINFYYPAQKSFDVSKKHNYDCEAMFCFNNEIYLFTKNRLNDSTNLYSLPTQPGNYPAKLLGSFNSGGRITGADISADGKKIALVGYNKKSDCFLWMIEGFTGDNFFKGKTKKYNLGPYDKLGQIEAVAFKNNTSLYLSSEEIANVPARLYLFKLDDFNK